MSPDPTFSGGLQKEARVVSLVIDLEDGTREILEFDPTNMPIYRVRGNMREFPGDPQVTRHDIFWKENHGA